MSDPFDTEISSPQIILVSAVLGATVFVAFYITKLFKGNTKEKSKKPQSTKSGASSKELSKKNQTVTNASNKSKKKAVEGRWVGRRDKQTFSHPWLLTSLKGHTGRVLDMDFSSNGKYLASCSEDQSIFLWCTKDLTNKNHKYLRVNVEFDHATHIVWSPDTKAFIINKANESCVEVYKVDKRKDGTLISATKAITFPKAFEVDAVGLGIAYNGRFIMTCSNKTDLILWNLSGEQLTRVDTYLMSTCCAKISPCGRFIVASGFAPDVKVWEVIFDKSGQFQTMKRAFELTGHSSGVYDVDFAPDSSCMATVSKDGNWKLFNTNVEYQKGEDPHLIITGKFEQCSSPPKIALSPNTEVLAITCGTDLLFYDTKTGKLDKTIEDIFPDSITSLFFDASGKYLLVAGDRHIHVFHNVTGYRTEIRTAHDKLQTSKNTSATRERLEKIIAGNKAFLKSLNENED